LSPRAEIQEWFRANFKANFSGELLFDEPLLRYTYYRIGGPAAVLAMPKSLRDLAWLRAAITATGSPVFVLGAGSNVLVSDAGFSGLVIRSPQMNTELTVKDGRTVRTGAGLSIAALLRRAIHEGWSGFEFLCGIPGTVGGAIAMNAGTQLGEVKDNILRVETVPLLEASKPGGTPIAFEGADLRFEYRRNLFLPEGQMIWAAEWRIASKAPAEVKLAIESALARRKATQPLDFPSCGSVFKNPGAGTSAWQVINQLGLRGHRVGNAQFSVKHSNFIVNLGGATAADVKALISLAQSRAKAELGIALECEVHCIGD